MTGRLYIPASARRPIDWIGLAIGMAHNAAALAALALFAAFVLGCGVCLQAG